MEGIVLSNTLLLSLYKVWRYHITHLQCLARPGKDKEDYRYLSIVIKILPLKMQMVLEQHPIVKMTAGKPCKRAVKQRDASVPNQRWMIYQHVPR